MDAVDIFEQYDQHMECTTNYEMGIGKPKAKERALKYLPQLEGWCTDYKASLLMDLIFSLQPEVVVEVGVFGGKSLIPIAVALKENEHGKIYGVDPWKAADSVVGMEGEHYEYWNKIDYEAILKDLVRKIKKWKLINQVEIMRTTSKEAVIEEVIDLIHIDGNHSEESALFDVQTWIPRVREGGIIIFDDLDWHTTESAQQWLNENCTKLFEIQDSNVWGVWMK